MTGSHADKAFLPHMAADGAASTPNPSDGALVEIADPGGLLAPHGLAKLQSETHAAIGLLGRPGEVRVRLIDDAAMSAAHEKFSNIPGTTDVLTFDLSEGGTTTGGPLDVDILACVDEARRQAESRGHGLERELLLYILHGALHCMGHDDHDDAAYERMHAEEDRILRTIGVGPVFHREQTRDEGAAG